MPKTKNRTYIVAVLILVLFSVPMTLLGRAAPLTQNVPPVPCGTLPTTPDGYLDPNALTYDGQFAQCLPPLCAEVIDPFTGNTFRIGVQLLFNRYTDPDGRVYYTPTTLTMIYMLLNPSYNPFPGYSPDGWIMNGWNALLGALGGYQNLGITREQIIAATGKDPTIEALNEGDWLRVFQSLSQDALFWVRLNLRLNQLAQQGGDWITWFGMVLVYCEDPVAPWDRPPSGGGSTPPPPPTWWRPPTSPPVTPVTTPPPPPPPPPPPVTPVTPPTPNPPADPNVNITINPPYPVVIRQDPYGRGVDISIEVKVPPCEFVVPVEVTTWTLSCNCIRPPAPPGSEGDECTEYLAECGGTGLNARPRPRTTTVPVLFVYPRPFGGADLQAFQVQLTPGSRDYILAGPISIKYPGMPVYREVWDLLGWVRGGSPPGLNGPPVAQLQPATRTVEQWVDEDKVFHWKATLQHIPFEDPGYYNVSLRLRIPRAVDDNGDPVTVDACAPEDKDWVWENAFRVYFRDQTLR